jgi:putative ABC transport system permease protein
MLRLKNITKNYKVANGEIEVLKGLNISFRKNEFVSILGPSGCGKTTTLNIVGGLDKYTSGDLIISGKSTEKFTDRDWDVYRNHRIGFVFQTYNLIPHQTVLGNVELALTISGVSKEERVKRSLKALERVGLKGEEYKRPNQLSGGQCQRVAIARALVNEPDILLADEPTGALDSKTSVQIMELIKEISKDKLVIMVTHNAEIAEQYSTRIVRLVDGEIVEDTNPFSEEDEIEEVKADIALKERAESNDNKKKKSKKQKAKMSFWTAFKLSLKNLFTKRGRTILTSFAGSIGIIGIALILAVSQGTTAYINHVQKTTLSSYPITLESQAIDLTSLMESFMGVGESKVEHDNDAIYKDPVIYELVNALSEVESSENDLKSFKSYLESEVKKDGSQLQSAVSGIKYTYDLQFDIYTENVDGEIIKSDTQELMQDMIARYMMGVAENGTQSNEGSSSDSGGNNMFSTMMTGGGMWQELLSELDGSVVNGMIKEQYDLIHGDWPKVYDEVVIVVNDKNEIDDLTLYALGLIGEEKIDAILDAAIEGKELPADNASWSYEDVCGRTYTTIMPYECYQLSGDGKSYVDLRKFDAIDMLYKNGLKLKVAGIIRENPDAENHMLTGSICYTYKLTEHIINNAKDAAIVKSQIDNPDYDILTGLPFKSATGSLTPEEKQADFIEYVGKLSVDDKAEKYVQIKCIMPTDQLAIAVGAKLGDYPNRDSKIKKVAEGMSKQIDLDEEQLKVYLTQLDDEQLDELLSGVLAVDVQTEYATKEAMKYIMMPKEDLAAELDKEVGTYSTESCALYYDTVTEFSESTYENNLKKLGFMDLDSPATINIYASSFENKDVIVAAIDSYNGGVEETKAIKYTDFMGLMMSSITTIIDAITYVLIAFVSISLIVSSIMIAVITLISVQERTKEIGILRSIGASKKDVSSMFNAETVIIGLTSGLTGVLVTYLLCIPINLILQALTGIPTLRAILPIGAAAILTLISVLLNLISGFIPSRSAAKKDPVVALRTE